MPRADPSTTWQIGDLMQGIDTSGADPSAPWRLSDLMPVADPGATWRLGEPIRCRG